MTIIKTTKMEVNDWIPVKGYEGLYEVSGILGKVRSLNYRGHGRVKIMEGNHTEKGYVRLILSKNGKTDTFREHRIVAEHFRPNPFNKPEVNHINEIKDDNRACNLEWVTHIDNCNHGTRNERVGKAQSKLKKGVFNTKCSKPVLQYTKTGEFVREWASTMECGRNGFNQGAVCRCCLGEKPQYKGYIWKYKERTP